MKSTELINFIIDGSSKLFESKNYHVAEKASGNCYDASVAMIWFACESEDANNERIKMVTAEHPNYTLDDIIPSEVLKTIGFVNHFAIMVDDEVIIDYTLRQFDESAPYPFIGNTEEWCESIAKRWNETAVVSDNCDY